jgi:hypothetical protein
VEPWAIQGLQKLKNVLSFSFKKQNNKRDNITLVKIIRVKGIFSSAK